ncbi:MAG: hypothetical protein A2099_00870 [Planctomycetes bacterium GWF2_39_10]|nr:MAG: hypothetical protein A2099_00870 [Planctomycetes bacterium GWF2_39_10]
MKFRNITITPKLPSFNINKLSHAVKQFRTNTAWGLDIGGHALKAVKIMQTPNELFVEDMDIIEYPVIPLGVNFMQSQYISEAVHAFLSKHHIKKTDNILVSIPGHLILSRFTTIPPVDDKQLKDVVNYEVKQQIPFDSKDIVWDYYLLTERTPGMESLETGLFASKRISLDNILTNIGLLKPKLTTLQVSPLAIYNFTLFDRQVCDPTIIINIEAENTDLIIVDGMHFWIRSIPLFSVDADFVKEIQRSIEYYMSLSKETVHFKTILLMGHGFKDSHNINFITDNFKYEVKVLKTLNNLRLSDKVNPAYFNESLIDLGVALGLAIQGIGLCRVKTNLLPQELIKAVKISRKKPYAIAVLGCLALSLAIQYCGSRIQINALNNSSNYHQKVLQNIKELEKKYKNTESLAQTSKSALNLISSIDSSRFFWIESLDKLLSLIPNNVSITNIQTSWIDADTLKKEVAGKPTSQGFFQARKQGTSVKPGTYNKILFMGIKGESKDPGISFIEEHILKPIQNLTLFDQKVPAFKDVEIVPGSCRQIEFKESKDGCISFEIRWIVKTQDEIQAETKSLPSIPGTPTSSVKS